MPGASFQNSHTQLIQPGKADVQAQYDAEDESVEIHGTGIRFEVSVSFTRDSKPSFSSIVITGNSPP